MGIAGNYVFQVGFFAVLPFIIAIARKPFKSSVYYTYFGILFVFTNLLGAVYSLPITKSIMISGGNIAYAAILMTVILMVITEKDISIIRHVILLIVLFNTFFIILYKFISLALKNTDIINPLLISSSLFSISLKIVIIGSALIIFELVLLIFLFEKLKRKLTNPFFLAIIYTTIFVIILCLDGLLFPVLAFTLEPTLSQMIKGGIAGKLILGVSFSVPLYIFFMVFRNKMEQYIEKPLPIKWLIRLSKRKLILEVERQRQAIGKAEDDLCHERYLLNALMDNIPDSIYFKDTGSRFIRVNKYVTDLFNLSETSGVEGKTDHDFFAGEYAKRKFIDEMEIIRTGTPLLIKFLVAKLFSIKLLIKVIFPLLLMVLREITQVINHYYVISLS